MIDIETVRPGDRLMLDMKKIPDGIEPLIDGINHTEVTVKEVVRFNDSGQWYIKLEEARPSLSFADSCFRYVDDIPAHDGFDAEFDKLLGF